MNPEMVTAILRQTLFTAIELAAPFLLIALITGALISFFQSMTQMHEMTLSFIPKMFLIAATIAIFFPWMLKMMTKFTLHLFVDQWAKVISPAQYVL